uniref:hypothetical protein n=1 Tax=Alloprevotella sp. TaxID=1872471 RepID=UPI003FED9122
MKLNKQKKHYLTPQSNTIAFEIEHCLLDTSYGSATTDMKSTHNTLKDAGAEQYSQQKSFNPIWSNMKD